MFDYREYFETEREFVTKADEVVVGKIVAERRGPVRRPSDEASFQNRILQIQVEREYKRQAQEMILIETPGWVITHDGERPVADSDGLRVEVGDRVALSVAVSKDGSGRRGLVSGQGALVLADGEVADTGRRDPTVRKLEAMSERQLEDMFEAAS